ncbi:hypothetical protein PILCRDRAFT_821759 [Piloderma croceum F 1598]|uniref:Uncharacterized protein n=1 Tax=Piloderma croceum (strain F 1598) TaxID=765440 RepID=A0A0C3BVB0_PILCF|nr:hypothetical protein PILCRDRAFT_821759 [Piloderma croceum F 1598]
MKASFTYSLTQQGLEAGSTVFAAGIVMIKGIVRTRDTPFPSAMAFGLSMKIIQRRLRYARDFPSTWQRMYRIFMIELHVRSFSARHSC